LNQLAPLPSVLALALAPLLGAQDDVPAEAVGIRLTMVSSPRAGKGGVAGGISARMLAYARANHPEWNATAYRTYSTGFGDLYVNLDFPGMDELEQCFDAWRVEEGWIALEQEYDAIFDSETGESYYLLPVTPLEPVPDDRSFRWMRFSQATFGKYAQAVEQARAVAAHVNANYEDTHLEVFAAYFGDLGEIHWVADFADPEAWRSTRKRLWEDPEYVRLMALADGLYVDGTWREELTWRIR